MNRIYSIFVKNVKRLTSIGLSKSVNICRWKEILHSNADCEFLKVLFTLVYLGAILFFASSMVVLAEIRTPNRQKYAPLPDIVLENMSRVNWGLKLAECIILASMCLLILLLFFHQRRLIILRRYLYLLGNCYLLRSITLPLTALSVPSHHLICLNVSNMTVGNALIKTMYVWSRQGFLVQGLHTCGDLMFSGHTCALTLTCLFLSAYSRGLYGHRVLVVIGCLVNLIGMFLILLAHEHYSIDVFIGFLVSCFLFRYYHVLADNPILFCDQQQNFIKQRFCRGDATKNGHIHEKYYDSENQLSFNSSLLSNHLPVSHHFNTVIKSLHVEKTFFPFFFYLEANSTGRFSYEFNFPGRAARQALI